MSFKLNYLLFILIIYRYYLYTSNVSLFELKTKTCKLECINIIYIIPTIIFLYERKY